MVSGESRIQVLKGVPFNIVLPNQLGQDKRAPFPSPDTTVTVSMVNAVSMVNTVKTEGSSHGFPVPAPPGAHCTEPDGHGVPFERSNNHSQFSPCTQPRTPDSTFPETFKDSSQEVR